MRSNKAINKIISIVMILLYVTVGILGIPDANESETADSLIRGYYIIGSLFLAITYLLNLEILKKHFKEYFKHFGKYFLNTIKYLVLSILAFSIARVFTYMIVNVMPSGDSLITTALNTYPLYVAFVTVIYTPFVEEVVFRKTLNDLIPNNVLFVIISGCLFGFFHIGGDFTNISEFISLFAPVAAFGIMVAYSYKKMDNIFVPIFIHLLYNSFIFLII